MSTSLYRCEREQSRLESDQKSFCESAPGEFCVPPGCQESLGHGLFGDSEVGRRADLSESAVHQGDGFAPVLRLSRDDRSEQGERGIDICGEFVA